MKAIGIPFCGKHSRSQPFQLSHETSSCGLSKTEITSISLLPFIPLGFFLSYNILEGSSPFAKLVAKAIAKTRQWNTLSPRSCWSQWKNDQPRAHLLWFKGKRGHRKKEPKCKYAHKICKIFFKTESTPILFVASSNECEFVDTEFTVGKRNRKWLKNRLKKMDNGVMAVEFRSRCVE